MVHLGVSDFIAGCLLISRVHSKEYPAADPGATACAALQITAPSNSSGLADIFRRTEGLANLVTRESKCRRIAVRP
jgi:hypothetical protein